jgi:hypothetical protein
LTSGNIYANSSTIQGNVVIAKDYLGVGGSGIAKTSANLFTTTAISSNQTLAVVTQTTDAMAVRFMVQSNDGSTKSQLRYVDVISMGGTVDYSITGPSQMGGSTGTIDVVW